jgi:predicted ribosomally synthesized peptide with nif11-like leader
MTQDEIQELVNTVKSNPTLMQQFAAATNVDDAVRIANEAGFKLSSDDIDAAVNSGSIALTDAELESVAGGNWGQFIKSIADGGESCGNALQKAACKAAGH